MARSKELRAEWKANDEKETKSKQKIQRISQWQEKQAIELQLADCLTSLAQNITTAVEAIAPYINDPFLHEVRDHPALPVRPTDRLTRSFAYGPIYRAFCDYQNQPGISFAPLKPGLMRALDSKAIHPACTLYELWVFVELYDILIHTFGFCLPAGATTGHPLDYVDSEMGEIVGDALKGREFLLELRPANNQQRVITVSLWYDTEERHRRRRGSYLRPDVYLEVMDSEADNGVEPFMFAIDAKYRTYPGDYYIKEREKHGVSTVFDLDLLVTAKKKYRETLGCDAAFVVHPDHNTEYTQWGGGPDPDKHWPGPEHHYGSVFAKPLDRSNLRRLLKCFLMYHMVIENICWSCRNEVEERNVLSKSKWEQVTLADGTGVTTIDVGKQPVGHDYLCPKCQRSWMITWCSNKRFTLEERVAKHKLLKIDNDNFHDRNLKGTICPTCGDGR